MQQHQLTLWRGIARLAFILSIALYVISMFNLNDQSKYSYWYVGFAALLLGAVLQLRAKQTYRYLMCAVTASLVSAFFVFSIPIPI